MTGGFVAGELLGAGESSGLGLPKDAVGGGFLTGAFALGCLSLAVGWLAFGFVFGAEYRGAFWLCGFGCSLLRRAFVPGWFGGFLRGAFGLADGFGFDACGFGWPRRSGFFPGRCGLDSGE